MSITLIILLTLALAASQVWWWRRLRRAEEKHRNETAVSQQHQAKVSAREQSRQAALFDSMIEGVMVLDAQGRIQLANRALELLFATKSPVIGKTVMEALRLHELNDLVERVTTEGQVLNFELRLAAARDRWYLVSAARVVDPGGGSGGTILVFHDLTRLKQLERAREEFVANVSHELRTPLSMIKGYAETLLDGASNEPEVADRFLRTIERHANRLALLIEDLLTISQLESGRIRLDLQAVSLRPLATKMIEDFNSRASSRKVTLLCEVPDLTARADANRVQQVLSNLLDNAIKYGRIEGTVIVGARATGDDMIELRVQDDGPGLPADSLERVFERFYRVDKARSREQGGTGLGLSIVKHIAQGHGGKAWVESEPGKGATFYFTLPMSTETTGPART